MWTLRKLSQDQQREAYTAGGFAALCGGLWLGYGLWLALIVGGAIVFGTGLYGLTRTSFRQSK